MNKIKSVKGTFMRRMYKDGGPNTLLAQEASIFDDVFAVYREGTYQDNWHVDHVPTGLVCTRVPRKKDAIAIVAALLAIPLDWHTAIKDELMERMDKTENSKSRYFEATAVRAE